jgi:carbonic anhydrase
MKYSHKMLAISTVLFIILLSACAPAASVPPTATSAPTAVHWTYEGEDGPAHWGELSPKYAACADGKTQSPIDLTGAEDKDLANIVFHYQPSKVNLINNGHTIQVNYDSGSYIEVDGVRYDLAQFHFHAPSEHSVNGKLAAAEVHFVHEDANDKLAVVGILIEKGAQSPAVQAFWDKLPTEAGPQQTLTTQANAADFLPAVQTTYRYDGSLTTPPCSEGVKWMVMTTPITFSEAQIEAYSKLFEHGTNRPVQELNGRVDVEDITP